MGHIRGFRMRSPLRDRFRADQDIQKGEDCCRARLNMNASSFIFLFFFFFATMHERGVAGQ